MNPQNKHPAADNVHTVVSIEIDPSEKPLAITSHLPVWMSPDEVDAFVSLVCNAVADAGVFFERGEVRRWAYCVPGDMSDQFLGCLDRHMSDDVSLSTQLLSAVVADGSFPIQALTVTMLDRPSVRVVDTAAGDVERTQGSVQGDKAPQDGSSTPDTLTAVVADLYDEVWSCEFNAYAFNTYFSSDSLAMAKANRTLSVLRSVLSEEEWDSIVTPIDDKWRTEFEELARADRENPGSV